jgi:hypothetical protein
MAAPPSCETIVVVGDVHGHLQLALCLVAKWQRLRRIQLEAVLLCGDIGSFTDTSQLDNATMRHAKENPCELEFLEQWSARPPPPWLERIFRPSDEGLGLTCPVVMVHGNHEGFAHLATLASGPPPPRPLASPGELPSVDSGGHLRYLPSGWRFRTPGGKVIAGIGGIEAGQRAARYHPLAYLDDAAILSLCGGGGADLLVSHQGPALIQGDHGSPSLDLLLEGPAARVWCHGHGSLDGQPQTCGTGGRCTLVPLGDIAFTGPQRSEPGLDGWCFVTLGSGEPMVDKAVPDFWREYRRSRWRRTRDGAWICPDLVPFVDREQLEP